MRTFFLLAALALLSACATLSEDACRAGNWADIGYKDGANGRETDHLARHAKACAEYGISPDPTAWEEGRRAGLPQYCRPERAWREGAKGRRLAPVCEGRNARELERQNERGRIYHRIGQDIAETERELHRIDRFFGSSGLSPEARSALLGRRSHLLLDLTTLRSERQFYRYRDALR